MDCCIRGKQKTYVFYYLIKLFCSGAGQEGWAIMYYGRIQREEDYGKIIIIMFKSNVYELFIIYFLVVGYWHTSWVVGHGCFTIHRYD